MATKKSKKTTKRAATKGKKKGKKAPASPVRSATKKRTSKVSPSKTRPKANAKIARGRSAGVGEALARALTLAMIADGEIASSERQVLARFAKASMFRGVDMAGVVDETIERCISVGPERVLADVASKLRSKDDRETAFSSCLAVVAMDGRATPSEIRMMRALAENLRISRARVKQLAGPLAGAFV